MDQEQKIDHMTTAPVERLVLELAAPSIMSMLVTSFYNMADTYFVSRINTESTAAVGVVFSLMAILQAVGFFFGHGSGNYISRCLGHKDFEKARHMASTGVVLAFLSGIVVAVLGLLFRDTLALALGSTPTILPYARDYLTYILLGAPFITTSFVLNNQLRFQGSSNIAMIGITTGAVLNIVLDPLLIFMFDMGIAGAAIATSASQVVGFFMLLWGTRRGGNIRLRLRDAQITPANLREIVRGGLPSLCRQGTMSIANIALSFAAGAYGDAAIASMSVVARLNQFAMSAIIGFGQGFQPVCGMNYGAGRLLRVKKAFRFCVRLSTVALVVLSVVGVCFASPIVGLFENNDPLVLEYGTRALILRCTTFWTGGYVIMGSMLLQTIARVREATILAIGRQCLFTIPFYWILPPLFGLGMTGIMLAQPVADIVCLALTIWFSERVLRTFQTDGE